MPAIEAAQAGQVGGGVARVGVAGAGVGLGQRVADRRHSRLRVARVVPPVRVVARRLGARALPRDLDRDVRAEIDDRRVTAGRLDDVAHPAVELVAVEEHDVGIGGLAHVGRAGLVVVRIGVGSQDLDDLGPLAADGTGEVGDLGRRRDDLGLPGRRLTEVGAAAGEQRERCDGGRGHGGTARAQHPARCHRREHPAGEHGDGRPGRRVDLHRQPQPRDALEGDEPDRGQLPRAQARADQPRGGGRDHEQRGGQQRAEGRERGDRHEGHEREQRDVGRRRAGAEGARRARGRSPSPASAARGRARRPPRSRR